MNIAPLTEQNVKTHTAFMRSQEIFRYYYLLYKNNMCDFVAGHHTQMYDVMLPIANYHLHEDPAIADMQTQFFNSFMVLNFDIYNSDALKSKYKAFSETEYNRLFSARQLAQKRPQNVKKNHILSATLCL